MIPLTFLKIYQNQFQTYHPASLVEHDVGPLVVSDDGPVMDPELCRAALQRSVAKIFYHCGFEETQPSALDVVTDVASGFFQRVVSALKDYREEPMLYDKQASIEAGKPVYAAKFTKEEAILHALHSDGIEIEGLETYCKEEVGRLGSKLGVMHERMKAHLAELLVSQFDLLMCLSTNVRSDPRWMLVPALMAQAPSTMVASNSLAATLQRTSMRTFLASRNSDLTKNLVWHRSVYLCTFCRTACTMRTNRKTRSQSMLFSMWTILTDLQCDLDIWTGHGAAYTTRAGHVQQYRVRDWTCARLVPA